VGLLAIVCSIASAQTVSVFNVRTSLVDLAPDDGIDPFISGGGIASLADQVAHPIDMLAPLVPRTISAHTQATVTIDWDLTLETFNNQFASAAAHVYSALWGYPAPGLSSLTFSGVIGASAIFVSGPGPYDNMPISKTFSYRDATVQVTNDTDEAQVFAWYAAAEFWRENGIPPDPPSIPEPETYAILLVGLSAVALRKQAQQNPDSRFNDSIAVEQAVPAAG
jgi:hypothetical protein